MAGEYIEFNNNSQPALNDTNINRLQQLIKQDIQGAVSGDTLPVGAIMPFGSDTIPNNWLLCNGQAVSRTDYQDLFNTIGIIYGSGDGFTTFNLPDLQGKIPVGLDENDTDFDTLGNTGGEKEHTLTVAEMPSHSHSETFGSKELVDEGGSGEVVTGNKVTFNGSGTTNICLTANTGESQSHNILQPYIVQNYIIKAKQSAGVVATVVDGLNSTSATNALSANQGRILNDRFNYSTTEKVVGTWIDGKPIYEKVLLTGSISAGSIGHVPFSRTNIDEILDCQCFGRDSSNNWFPLSRAHPNYFRHQISIYYNYPENEFSIEMGTEISISKGYIIARYTKTTD